MHPSTLLSPQLELLRPLLPIGKAQLVATLEARQQPWIEDPSNQNHDYTRPRIRAQLAQCPEREALSQRAYAVTNQLLKFRKLLEKNLAGKLTEALSIDDNGANLLTEHFVQLAPEYGLRTICHLSQIIGKRSHNPRTEKLERFYAQLLAQIKTQKNTRLSFAGCIYHLQPKHGRIRVQTEITRAS
jgi:tRNA(Ile)-lysidine synthase